MDGSLLPQNSTALERALEAVIANPSVLSTAAGLMTSAKLVSPPPSYLPYLIEEYGLGELTPYVPNLYDLIREGIEWQRIRGTPNAIVKGLGWLNYAAALEEAWPDRRFWNSFQLRFTSLPVNDAPDLERIEGIAGLSVALRSKFRRGVYQYDAGALEADAQHLDDAMLDFESGAKATNGTLLFPEGATWSFGRTAEFEHTLTEAEGLAIGNWIEPVEDGTLPWVEMTFPWIEYVASWAATPEEQRRANMAGWFSGKILYAALRNDVGTLIGYRRCRAVRPVRSKFDGTYTVGVSKYEPAVGGTSVYVEAMTQFDDANGVEAKQVSLLVGGVRSAGVPAGRQWLLPNQLSGGAEIAVKSISIPLRKTVRDQFKFLLRF